MSGTRLEQVLRQAVQDLSTSGASFALAGGLAVSVRAEPRFTRDLDMAVLVEGDREAETLVKRLRGSGYVVLALVEQKATGRLATVRLRPPGEGEGGVVVDLLFASSGIEKEIVQAGEPLEVLDGLVLKVATTAHLIAMKVLSRDDARRPQDRADLLALLREATDEDLAVARRMLRLIRERGFHREKDLLAELDGLIASR
jgi:hypothetical protein